MSAIKNELEDFINEYWENIFCDLDYQYYQYLKNEAEKNEYLGVLDGGGNTGDSLSVNNILPF